MPRHTHPRPTSKHSRAHTRHQRERWIERRWARIKSGERINHWEQSVWDRRDFYLQRNAWRPLYADEQAIADRIGQVGPIVYVHPEVARHLPKEMRAMVGDYEDNIERWLRILPRRLSYRGSESHPCWGWRMPRRGQLALDYRGKARLAAEIDEGIADREAVVGDPAYAWTLREQVCECHECYSAIKDERFAWAEWLQWGDKPEWERNDAHGRALREELFG